MQILAIARICVIQFPDFTYTTLTNCSGERCAGRELNPGYELGKLMSYH